MKDRTNRDGNLAGRLGMLGLGDASLDGGDSGESAVLPAPDADVDARPAHLAACLLLAGGLKPSPLTAATGTCPLDLHLTAHTTIFGAWLQQCERLCDGARPPLDLRIIHGQATPRPAQPRHIPAGVRLVIEHDGKQYRGPAGIARDTCGEYAEEATILIAEAARFVAADLSEVVAKHHERGADITVVCNADSSPAGIFVARRRTLDLVPRVGFMDLKEQWLTRAVNARLYVRVHRLNGNPSYELRTPAQFLAAAAAAAAREAGAVAQPAATDSSERSPEIAPGAVVVDSVVMPGAVIAERCVVVRSIVCAGARLEAGTTVIDQVVRRSVRHVRRAAGRMAQRE